MGNVIEFKKCNCGCGENVNPKRLYKPGHDARHAGRIAREVAAGGPESLIGELPSQPMRDKAARMFQRLSAKAEPKATKIETGEVKAGRWTYPAKRSGRTVRYTKKDGSEHVATDKVAATFEAK